MSSPDFDRALHSWLHSLTAEEKLEFAIYRMRTLLSVRQLRIDWGLLEAAATRWDPVHHVFCFGDHELTLLPEEFSAIFGFPTKAAPAIPDMSPGFHKQFERLLGLSKLEVTSILDGRTVDLMLIMKKFAPPSDDVTVRRYKRRALCLCLLHRYLLVNSRGHKGDASLISIVEQLEQDRTPIPLIVGETLMALDRMKQDPRAPMGGSPLLLQIWLQEHLSLVHSPPNPLNYNIRSFANRRKCNMQTSFEDWNRFLGTYGESSVRWTMSWLKLTEVTVAPYRHNHVRLISLSRTTFIFPCRVMRQLGRRQLIPNEDTHPPNSEAQSPHLLHTWAEHWVKRTTLRVLTNPETVKVSAAYKSWMTARHQQVRNRAREREELELSLVSKRKADAISDCGVVSKPAPKLIVAPSKYGRKDDYTIPPASKEKELRRPAGIVINERDDVRSTPPLIVYGKGKSAATLPLPTRIRSKRSLVWRRNVHGETSAAGASKAPSKVASVVIAATGADHNADEVTNPTGDNAGEIAVASDAAPKVGERVVSLEPDTEMVEVVPGVSKDVGENPTEVSPDDVASSSGDKGGLGSWEATWADDDLDTAMSEGQGDDASEGPLTVEPGTPSADSSKNKQD